MNYTVVWVPDALNELTAVWMVAPNQNAVTEATYRIDRRLWPTIRLTWANRGTPIAGLHSIRPSK